MESSAAAQRPLALAAQRARRPPPLEPLLRAPVLRAAQGDFLVLVHLPVRAALTVNLLRLGVPLVLGERVYYFILGKYQNLIQNQPYTRFRSAQLSSRDRVGRLGSD